MGNRTLRRIIVLLAATVAGVSFMHAANASLRIAATRPAAVPEGYMITPFGYFHPSCVNRLAKGDVLHQESQTIERASGSIETIPMCAYPHYRADGEKVIGDERAVANPDISHAWVENANVTTTTGYGRFWADWIVPPAPTSNDGQTVFLFNGLEDINDVVSIIQPVLGWNADFAGAWGIASWNCCINGNVNEATPVQVKSGDLIYGWMSNNCAKGTETCASWSIETLDLTTLVSSAMNGTSNYGQTFNWAFGGVLEVYNIIQCSDYPPDPIHFFNQGLSNDKFVQIKPKWVMSTAAGLTPSCSYKVSLPEEIILNY
jgi:hypothetical protein